MGSVYAAVDLRLDRDVALKVMREDLARDPSFVERFRKEARSAARLSHPHVVAVHDQGDDDGLVFLTMELVEGRTLRAWIREAGALTPREALGAIADVLKALSVAHRAGIVHRDIKPENVLISTDGVVKVADFGLARAVTSTTATALSGTVMGTVAYLAPEQVERGIADARSDVYAAGLMLHEMLTGRPAIEGSSPIHIAYQHVHGHLPSPSDQVPALPSALDDLVAAATQRDPDDRPADASAWLPQVLACLGALTPAQLDARPARAGVTPAEADPGSAPGGVQADRGRADTNPPAINDTRAVARSTQVLSVRGAGKGTDRDTGEGTDSDPEPAADAKPRRRRWPYVVAPIVAVLLLIGWYAGLGPGSIRPVPPVVGDDQTVAVGDIRQAGLRSAVTEEFSETVPAGRVIGAQPGEGSEATRWSTVTLAVSKGPERYDVPNLTGLSEADANEALKQVKLVRGITGRNYSETVPADRVTASSPKAGTRVKPGTVINVTLSRGRQPIPLVSWVGKPATDASAALRKFDVKVQITSEEFHPTIPKGSIVSQQPAPRTLHRGDSVTFVVSKGPDLVAVPNVRGKGESEAEAALVAAGFAVKVERIAGGLFGTAHSTNPGAGKKAPRGSTITLRIV